MGVKVEGGPQWAGPLSPWKRLDGGVIESSEAILTLSTFLKAIYLTIWRMKEAET